MSKASIDRKKEGKNVKNRNPCRPLHSRLKVFYALGLGSSGWLFPRRINGLGDYFHCGLLPQISGIYAKEKLVFTDLPYTEPTIDAVFLSHAHFDHIAHIEFLDPEIPVYLGVGTKLFVESQEETSSFCHSHANTSHLV